MTICKFDRNNCGSKIELYNNGTGVRLKTLGKCSVRCNTGIDSGKWYWEVKRNSHTHVDSKSSPPIILYTMIQIGVVSKDANINWEQTGGFTNVGGWNGSVPNGVGLHYASFDNYDNRPVDLIQSTEILGTSTIGENGVLIASSREPAISKALYTEQYKTIGFHLDVDAGSLYIYTGDTTDVDKLGPTNTAVVALPLGKTYYPAVGLWNDNQSELDEYGPLEVQYNFGESGPFDLGLPKGFKPYYMACKHIFGDLKIY